MCFSRLILSFFLTLSFLGKVNANVNLDSLWFVWNDTTASDTNRLNAIETIARDVYLPKSPDSALYFAQLQYDFAEKVFNKLGQASALSIQGISNYVIGNYDESLRCHMSSLELYIEIGDDKNIIGAYSNIGLFYAYQNKFEEALPFFVKKLSVLKQILDQIGIGSACNDIGQIYSELGNHEKALDYYLEGLKTSLKIGDKKLISRTYLNLGHAYSFQKNYEKALVYFNKSLEGKKEIGDKKGMALCYNNIGTVNRMLGKYETAIENYQIALDLGMEIGEKNFIGNAYYSLGIVNMKLEDYEKSLDYLSMCMGIYDDIGDKKQLGESNIQMGICYKKQGKNEKALPYLLEGKKVFEDLKLIGGLDEAAKHLMEVYESLDMPQKALENHKLYVSLKDSLAKIDGVEKERQRQFHEQYLLEKQADSIKYVDEIILHQTEAEAEKQNRNSLLIILALILVSLVIVFSQLNKVKKGKKLVEDKNTVIEEKQQEITDSINYAKHLQEGILVPFDLVNSWISESFIFFKPKDIVSGDFYWVEKVDDKVYFAVADCTGHGIPGALISVICANALTKSLHELHANEPAKILDHTRKVVEEQFIRAKYDIKDGMDISLCCLNEKEKTITWAGAMNPLWVVRKNANKIEELIPDRQPVGKVQNPIKYNQYEIKLEEGDCVYLFSDGFQDQFGGEKGRKYMRGNLKKFILSIQDQDMQAQLASFEKEFNSWKGDREQIDDVCVMGVRIT